MENDQNMQKWTKMQEEMLGALKELGDINTNTMSRLTERQMEMMSLYMESGSKQLKAMGEAKNVQDVVTVQTKTFSELNEKLVENARQTGEILNEMKDNLSKWLEKSMQAAKANMSQTGQNQ